MAKGVEFYRPSSFGLRDVVQSAHDGDIIAFRLETDKAKEGRPTISQYFRNKLNRIIRSNDYNAEMRNRGDQIKNELLVVRSQEGDPEAFANLVRKWQEPLWRYARRITADEDAAWDTLQETWIAVAKGIRNLEDAAAFPAWAYRITSNKARDWIRRESRRRKVHLDYAEEHEDFSVQTPQEPEGKSSLGEILNGLPRQVQLILQLRYEQEFNTRAIAEILSIPEGTVKSRLYHARAQLRKLLKEENNG